MVWSPSKRSAWTRVRRARYCDVRDRKQEEDANDHAVHSLHTGREQAPDFEAYARAIAAPIERCGGKVVGYYAPTKFAGPTNSALSLIDFPSLAVYERYREALAADPEHLEVARRAGQAGVILVEDRSFVQRVS